MSYYLKYIVPFADSRTNHICCFVTLWHWPLGTDLKVYRINGRSNFYIPAKFHWNSLINNRENSVQQICQGCVLMTLTLNLRAWNLNQVVPLSSTTHQPNLNKDRVINNKLLTMHFHRVSLCDLDLCTHKCKQLFYTLLSINWPNMRKIRWKMEEKLQNADSWKEKV